MNKYMAIAYQTGWTVGKALVLSVQPLGNVRLFKTYEEADEAAKYIADGKFDAYSKGIYVSNR